MLLKLTSLRKTPISEDMIYHFGHSKYSGIKNYLPELIARDNAERNNSFRGQIITAFISLLVNTHTPAGYL